MAPPRRPEDYTVGWVCALPVELAAAQEMLDEEHPDLKHDPADNDENLYALGSIAGHNVAIVCLPAGRIGNNPAAAVAMQMRATFKKIRFGLMVGIGGGVPGADVRLGDVVVSQPSATFAGVVQYDAGKATTSGFRRVGALNAPPSVLLAAVSKVRANELRGKSKLSEHVAKLEAIRRFQRSRAGPDVLYNAAYNHEAGAETCVKCSNTEQELREARDSGDELVTHYGTIASGNQVIKDAPQRDKLCAELGGGILCFEMEAAGLMNSFPCLIVRGVCDYADSHKNDKWQPYAAATAAAYAKELLSVIPPAEVSKAPTVEETMKDAIVKPTYYIPFQQNHHFVGRCDELAELRQRLLDGRSCRKMTIQGLGGMGKTQIALQFAYMVKKAQPEWSIFWLPALSIATFEQACADIVAALDLEHETNEKRDPKALFKRYLESGWSRRMLLVVDNADDKDILLGDVTSHGINDYLPASDRSLTLYTTRNPKVAELTPGDTILLKAMDRQDATNFLQKSLNRKPIPHDDENGSSTKLMNDLLDELTCLPLAIAQAAAYMNYNRISISNYLRLLQSTEHNSIVISKEFLDTTRYPGSENAVARTWVVSFTQIEREDPIAVDLLRFISCIEWKAIPRSLLPNNESEARLEKAIGILCGYSFLARRSEEKPGAQENSNGPTETGADEEWFDMHRLVHLATSIWIQKHSSSAKAVKDAIQHVNKVFPDEEWANRRVWRAYLPHTLRLLSVEQTSVVTEKSALCLSVGLCLLTEGGIREAVTWLEECYRLRSNLKQDDPDLLIAQHCLAMGYHDNRQIKEAIELLEAVVKAKETLDPDNPSRLASQQVLAGAYEAGGRTEEAIELLEAVVKAEETLEPDNPSRLASQHTLAIAYQADGRTKEAIQLLERVVKIQDKALAASHPDRLASQHVLAIAYQADGRTKEAIGLQESVVEIATRSFRADHPWLPLLVNVLTCMQVDLAATLDEASSSTSLENQTTARAAESPVPYDTNQRTSTSSGNTAEIRELGRKATGPRSQELKRSKKTPGSLRRLLNKIRLHSGVEENES